MNTSSESMNTMEKPTKTMETSMKSANGKNYFQNSAKYSFLLQNVANSKDKCPKVKNKTHFPPQKTDNISN